MNKRKEYEKYTYHRHIKHEVKETINYTVSKDRKKSHRHTLVHQTLPSRTPESTSNDIHVSYMDNNFKY